MNLYLIRHGATEWSISGQHTGRTDLPLTLQGESEARALGHTLRSVTFSRIWTSPRVRALRTAELSGLAEAADVDADLAEWDYGDYEGLRSDEILRARPGWNLFRDGCPGGESPADVAARADRVIERAREVDGQVAVFSHGHFGRALAARWLALPIAHGQQFVLNTASVSILGYSHPPSADPAILLWNVVCGSASTMVR